MKQPQVGAGTKNILLCNYASGTLLVLESDSVDATAQKLVKRMREIDRLILALRTERNSLTTALSVAGFRPPEAHKTIYTQVENEYKLRQPFREMPLTDSCLRVLRDHRKEWLDKNQVEYMVSIGGYVFETADSTNSVNITLRRLALDGFCEAHGSKGSRATRYRFVKDREPMI